MTTKEIFLNPAYIEYKKNEAINKEIINKELFKLKKITTRHLNPEGEIVEVKEMIGVLIPNYAKFLDMLDDYRVEVICLDGTVKKVRYAYTTLEDITLENDELSNIVNEIIEFSKENYEFQKDKSNFTNRTMNIELNNEDLEIKNTLDTKSLEQQKKLNILLNKLKKHKGLLERHEILDNFKQYINKEECKEWRQIPSHPDNYEFFLDKANIVVSFYKDKIYRIEALQFVGLESYDINDFDFIYKNNKGKHRLQLDKIENSKDFADIKDNHFNYLSKEDLEKLNLKGEFSGHIEDNHLAYIFYNVYSDTSIDCYKENLDDINNKFKSIVDLF